MSRKKILASSTDVSLEGLHLIKEEEVLKSLPEQVTNLSQIELLRHLQRIDEELYNFHQRFLFLDQSIFQTKARLVKLKLKQARVLGAQARIKKKLISFRRQIKKTNLLLETPSVQNRSTLTSRLALLKADKLKFRQELQRLENKRLRLRDWARKFRGMLKTWTEERRKARQLFKERRDGLEAQRKILQDLVEPYLARVYEKLLERYDGRAVVRVNEGVCQGCHTMIPSCAVSALVGKRIVTCEGCQRFLYFVPTPLEPVFDLKKLAVEEPRRIRAY